MELNLQRVKYQFINQGVNKKTVIHYFTIFDRVIMRFYINELNCKIFEGEVEIDESHLFKTKPSFAPHRNLSLGDVWLFGISQRSNA